MRDKYLPLLEQVSKDTGVPADLMDRMITTESGWNPKAVSPKGAKGLAQFMPETAKQYGVNPDDPESSIKGLGNYMKDLLAKYDGDRVKAVSAYNWGMGNLEKQGIDKAPAETRGYLKKVLGIDLDTYNSISVPNYFSPAQKQQALNLKELQREADENIQERMSDTVSFGDALEAGARVNFTHPSAIQKIKELLSDSDPNYVPPSADEMEKLLMSKGLGMEYAPRLYEARSKEHLSSILGNMAEEQEARNTLAKSGYKGTIASLLTGLADPAGLALGLATGGIGFLAAKGRAAYTAGQVALGAAGSGALEATLYGLQETKPEDEILAAALTGAIFQGGLGQFGYRSDLQAAFTRDIHRAISAKPVWDRIREAEQAGNEVEALRIAEELPFGYKEAYLELKQQESTVGAQQAEYVDDIEPNRTLPPTMEEIREDYIREGSVGSKFQKYRIDAAGYLLGRPEPTAKLLSRLGQDPIGLNADNKAVGFSAEEHRNRLFHSTHTTWLREYGQAFKEFDQGNSWFGREKRRKEFNARIADLYEMNVPESAMSPAEAKAVKATRAFFEEYKRQLQESGIVGPDGPIERLREGNYLPHILDHYNIRRIVDEVLPRRSADLADFLYNSIRSKALKDGDFTLSPEDIASGIDPKEYETNLDNLFKRIAQGYTNNILHYGNLRHLLGFTGVSLKDATTIRGILADANTDPELIDRIVNAIGAKDQKPGTSRLKGRVDFDMEYTQEFTKAGGSEGSIPVKVTLRMSDLFNRDLDSLIPMYGHQMAGHIGVAKATGIKSRSQLIAALNKYREEAVGVPESEVKKVIDYSNYLYDAVTGVPFDKDPSDWLVTWGRRLRDFNFAVRGGQFVWSQLTEAGPMLANIGIPALFKQIPSLPWMITLAKDGKLSSGLLRQLEAATGIGAGRFRNQIFTHFNPQDGSVVQGIDRALHKAGNFVGDVSLFNAVMVMEQRMMLAGMSQHLVDLAKKYKGTTKGLLKDELGETLDTGAARELRQLGMSDDQLETLFQHLADPSKVQFGMFGKVHVFKESAWDPDVWNNFVMGLHRITTTVIQENSYGGTIPLMHSSLAKLLLQFRNFGMNAIYKQSARGLALSSQTQFLSLAYAVVFGATSYIGQTYTNYKGTDSLEERLSNQKIVEGVFTRIGQLSMLPAVVGWITNLYPGADLFNYSRSSGLGSDLVGSIPSVKLVDDLYNFGVGSLNALVREDYDFTRKQYRALLGVLPVASIPVLKNFLESLGQDLPKSQPKDYGFAR